MKALETNNNWYFRNVAAVGDDDSSYDSVMLPVDQITGIVPGGQATRIRIHFEQVTTNPTVDDATQNGYVQLVTTAGYQKDVLRYLAEAANSSTHHKGYQTIADEVTGELAHKNIKSVSVIFNR